MAACQNKGRITKSYCRPKAGGQEKPQERSSFPSINVRRGEGRITEKKREKESNTNTDQSDRRVFPIRPDKTQDFGCNET